MTEELQKHFTEFAHHFGRVGGFLSAALTSDDIQAEFAARGIPKRELQALFEKMRDIEPVFYKEPEPL